MKNSIVTYQKSLQFIVVMFLILGCYTNLFTQETISIGSNDVMHFNFRDDKNVTAGSSNDLTNMRDSYRFSLANGKSLEDVLCISSNNVMHFAWYKDGTVSTGSSDNLGNKRTPYKFRLASGKKLQDVFAISSNDVMHFAWYKDGTVSTGSSDNLSSMRTPYKFKLASGKTLEDVLFISSNNVMHFAWYKDGTVSAGNSDNLSSRRTPYKTYYRTISADTDLSSKKETNEGLVVEYNSDNLSVNLGSRCSEITLRPKIKVAIKNNEFFLGFSTDQTSIELPNPNCYVNKNYYQGYFLEKLEIEIDVINTNDLEIESWGPKNVNSEGVITDMSSVGVGLSKDGPNVNYTIGTSTTRTINDFELIDNTSESSGTEWEWKLSKTSNGKYDTPNDLAEFKASQITGLVSPPKIARKNFPVYAQAVFKSKISKNIKNLPNVINVKVTTRSIFREVHLDSAAGEDEAGQFWRGFTFLARPDFYSGNLLYHIQSTQLTDEREIVYKIDISELKN